MQGVYAAACSRLGGGHEEAGDAAKLAALQAHVVAVPPQADDAAVAAGQDGPEAHVLEANPAPTQAHQQLLHCPRIQGCGPFAAPALAAAGGPDRAGCTHQHALQLLALTASTATSLLACLRAAAGGHWHSRERER